ncbi:hypothetical protein ZOSMA_16G01280 [Zostera marina]|uniref:Uncharacterized protein n=1 Tax=Zostera marina TaxID=29655 RepID=A0A0K9PT87_ZOSMR|nr:hypothetical protein ZOSMA_16G01280 [Zostera marina]
MKCHLAVFMLMIGRKIYQPNYFPWKCLSVVNKMPSSSLHVDDREKILSSNLDVVLDKCSDRISLPHDMDTISPLGSLSLILSSSEGEEVGTDTSDSTGAEIDVDMAVEMDHMIVDDIPDDMTLGQYLPKNDRKKKGCASPKVQ